MAKRAFNLPNMLTYARIVAVPLVVLCFFLEGHLKSSDFARWSALIIFLLASITDYLDGYLARAWQQTSNIGKMLDPIADKLLVATCLLLLAAGDAVGKMENRDPDGRHSVPLGRTGRRQDLSADHADRAGSAVDRGVGHALHRLRLFPRRPQAHHGRVR
jgi:hypothetical protein